MIVPAAEAVAADRTCYGTEAAITFLSIHGWIRDDRRNYILPGPVTIYGFDSVLSSL